MSVKFEPSLVKLSLIAAITGLTACSSIQQPQPVALAAPQSIQIPAVPMPITVTTSKQVLVEAAPAQSADGINTEKQKLGDIGKILPSNTLVDVNPPNKQSDKEKFINLTPFTQYEDKWNAVGSMAADRKELGANFSDCYTRLLITSDIKSNSNNNSGEGNGDKIDEYPYKPRWWITRALVGKEFSLNFSAKINVDSMEETIPLVTIGHESNSDGEKWSRVIRHADRNNPLFLVKGNGNGAVPKITATMYGSQSYASRGAASALQVVFGVANAISPASAVATKLSAQSSKDRSTALDSAISKLFGTAVKEEHTTSPDFRFWNVENGQPNGINLTLAIPYPDESWGDDNKGADSKKKKREVGTWTITFDYPRPSIFADWRICEADKDTIRCKKAKETAKREVLKEIDAGEVLNYELLNDGNNLSTIRAYLVQQEWFIQSQTKLVAAKARTSGAAEAIKPAANQMCRNIHNAIAGLNLSGFDADIVVWAVLKGMPMPDGSPTYSDMLNAEDCKSATDLIQAART